MISIEGKYGIAKIFNDFIEETALSQVYNLMNNEISKDSQIRIMPDVHAGAGCVIGYTATFNDKIVPNLIGVDINCGLLGYNLGNKANIDFQKLDNFIRTNIPSGRDVNERIDEKEIEEVWGLFNLNKYYKWTDYKKALKKVCDRTNQDFGYVLRSLGSLGGGNHFIELNKDQSNNNIWLIVHSGSRNFGLKVATHHQKIAENESYNNIDLKKEIEKITKIYKGKEIERAIKKLKDKQNKNISKTGLEYLSGEKADDYLSDMNIAQWFAKLNRNIIIYRIITKFFNEAYKKENTLSTSHNYIDFMDNIIRKGAVSAHKDQELFIPMNMAYGTLLCKGKGNSDYNYSAPHGAGRLMSRGKAKENISLEKFKEKMNGIWTSCVSESTLDEAPQAYKNPEDIVKYLEPTVEIISVLKSLYNFKA